jgi:hypothetical protein
MLRITADETPPVLTYRLEGRLVGPWVRVLDDCWLQTRGRRPQPSVRVDLTAVTTIDAAGKALLSAMYHSGAELIAGDGLSSALADEIVSGYDDRPGDHGRAG